MHDDLRNFKNAEIINYESIARKRQLNFFLKRIAICNELKIDISVIMCQLDINVGKTYKILFCYSCA